MLVEQVYDRLNTQWASHVAPPELTEENEELQSKLAQEVVGDRILRDCSREFLLLLDCICGTIITKKDFPQFSDTGEVAAYASKGVSKQGLQIGTIMETLILNAGQEGKGTNLHIFVPGYIVKNDVYCRLAASGAHMLRCCCVVNVARWRGATSGATRVHSVQYRGAASSIPSPGA